MHRVNFSKSLLVNERGHLGTRHIPTLKLATQPCHKNTCGASDVVEPWGQPPSKEDYWGHHKVAPEATQGSASWL